MTPQTPAAAGIRSQIRERLERIADEEAAKSTRVAIAIPGGPITDAMFEIFSSTPRVPDYDEAGGQRRFSTRLNYRPAEVPADPDAFRVRAEIEGDDPAVVLEDPDAGLSYLFDIEVAEELFLAGLAAVNAARAARDEMFAARRAPGEGEQPPSEVVAAMFGQGVRE